MNVENVENYLSKKGRGRRGLYRKSADFNKFSTRELLVVLKMACTSEKSPFPFSKMKKEKIGQRKNFHFKISARVFCVKVVRIFYEPFYFLVRLLPPFFVLLAALLPFPSAILIASRRMRAASSPNTRSSFDALVGFCVLAERRSFALAP